MDKKLLRSHPSLSDVTETMPPLAWREEHEEILRKWKARCFVNLWLCVASAYFYSVLHNWLSYPVIIMSSVSSAALFTNNNQMLKYVLGLVTLSCGIITCTMRHLKPGEIYQSHSSFAKKYLSLIRTVDTCLSLTINMRPPPEIFLDRIGNELDMLEASQLDPPLLIVKRFEKKYGAMHRILYGDDIIELMKIELQASKLYNKIRTSNLGNFRLSDVSSCDRRMPSIDETRNFDITKFTPTTTANTISLNKSNRQ